MGNTWPTSLWTVALWTEAQHGLQGYLHISTYQLTRNHADPFADDDSEVQGWPKLAQQPGAVAEVGSHLWGSFMPHITSVLVR
jgi:hypothetical protein